MSFSFLDLVLFAGVVQGIFLIFSLQFISQKNRNANKLLTIIVGLATFIFAAKMAAFQISAIWVWRVSLLSDCTIYLFGPLLYAYFRTLVYKEHPKTILSFLHFIPSIMLFLFFIYTLFLTTKEYFTIGRFKMAIAYFIMELAGVVSLSVYSIVSYRILRRVKNSAQKEYAHTRKLSRYLQFILIGFLVTIVFWSFGILKVYIIQTPVYYISYGIVWISLATFLFIVGYFSFTQPEIIRLPVEKNTPSKDRLNKKDIDSITEKLEHLIHEEKVFVQSDLNLKKLAKKLDTSSNNLSWLLNSVYEKTFYEYINEYRIKAFLTKIEEGEHKKQTILAIAMDAGFNSKSTFNKSFKTIMNETPSHYIDKINS